MKKCNCCGNKLFDDAVVCTMCGSKQEIKKKCTCCGNELSESETVCRICGSRASKVVAQKDFTSVFWFIISLAWWFVGIILYFAFRNNYPQRAKACMSGTITNFVISIIILIIGFAVAMLNR